MAATGAPLAADEACIKLNEMLRNERQQQLQLAKRKVPLYKEFLFRAAPDLYISKHLGAKTNELEAMIAHAMARQDWVRFEIMKSEIKDFADGKAQENTHTSAEEIATFFRKLLDQGYLLAHYLDSKLVWKLMLSYYFLSVETEVEASGVPINRPSATSIVGGMYYDVYKEADRRQAWEDPAKSIKKGMDAYNTQDAQLVNLDDEALASAVVQRLANLFVADFRKTAQASETAVQRRLVAVEGGSLGFGQLRALHERAWAAYDAQNSQLLLDQASAVYFEAIELFIKKMRQESRTGNPKE
ncbi:hypothetical protein CcaCcLH18_12132 [Colletotrichum camelliae]|nr:hypothetical protein CcaCcLH18_12132 [Colletotrichum camelliae]